MGKDGESIDIPLKFRTGSNLEKEETQDWDLIPGILELLQYMTRDRNIRIAFFSSARAVRNEALIPIIIEKAFPTNHEEF
jgi:hypothetical protein